VDARAELDAAAFAEFVAARSGSLFRTAYLVLGDYQLAQDLVQESLIKMFSVWPRLRDAPNAEGYARRIIVTTSVSWRRRPWFHERPTEVLPEVAAPDRTDHLGIQEVLWTELLRLPPRQRAAVVLRFCEDLSEAQTAELMRCSVGSVKKHTSLGVARLRQGLGPGLTFPARAGSDESAVTR
jgi:RNA polymerase sigma-70 factor (sigma-E family)